MSIFSLLRFIIDHPLNEGRKLRSVAHFIRWQISSRLVPGQVLYEWINGSKFLVRSGETGLTGNIYTGLHEFHDMAFLLHLLRRDDLFVDVGANAGSYTILACAVAGARGYAFEPIPETFGRLCNNIIINRIGERVIPKNIGIGKGEGVAFFTSNKDTVNHVVCGGQGDASIISVNIDSLDNLLKSDAPTAIKIDVEGFEGNVIEGAAEVLKKASLLSVIVETNGSSEAYDFGDLSIVKALSVYGFEPYSYNPFGRKLTVLQGKNLKSGNTIFIKEFDRVTCILQNAPMFSTNGKIF